MSCAKVIANNAPGGEMKERAQAISGGVSFFDVPLVCGAAPHLGCGTLAKPILSQIEKEVSVREAWLNRQGTRLAVVWARWSGERPDAGPVLSILNESGLNATEIVGRDLNQALTAFHAGQDWYRATQIDRLSEEEAVVIAARLVRRLRQRIALTTDQADRLVEALGRACESVLTDASGTPASDRLDQIVATLPGVGGELLDGAGLTAFVEVVALGHRPLSDEA